ncbi:hypothetical protein C8Q75DRAFT_809818 [Abortiporus biennis]|nr:hypothetical protein C8Q75DRAFT_809818 [Abortiporus biennis]
MVLNEYARGTSSWRSCFEMPRLNLDDDEIAHFSSSFRHLVLPSPVISHNPPNDFRLERCQSAKNLLVFSESLNANQPVFIDYLVRPYQLHNGRNIQNLFAANNFMCFLASPPTIAQIILTIHIRHASRKIGRFQMDHPRFSTSAENGLRMDQCIIGFVFYVQLAMSSLCRSA